MPSDLKRDPLFVVARLCFVAHSARGFDFVTMADDEANLWLAANVGTTQPLRSSTNEIAIELRRGEKFRDRVDYRAVFGIEQPWHGVFRVKHGPSHETSSRLTATLSMDNLKLTSCRLLVTVANIDAQGRFVCVPQASEATRLAYADEFEQMLGLGEKSRLGAHRS